jgi:hypothetical protein
MDVTQVARDASPDAMRTLIAIFRDPTVTPGVRATCAEKVIERAYGKAPQISAHIHARAKPQDLSDDQLLRIIAGEPLTSVLAEPDVIEHEPLLAAPQPAHQPETQLSSDDPTQERGISVDALIGPDGPIEPTDTDGSS